MYEEYRIGGAYRHCVGFGLEESRLEPASPIVTGLITFWC